MTNEQTPAAPPAFAVGDRVGFDDDGEAAIIVGRIDRILENRVALIRLNEIHLEWVGVSRLRPAPCPPGQPDDGERREIARRLAAGETVKVLVRKEDGSGTAKFTVTYEPYPLGPISRFVYVNEDGERFPAPGHIDGYEKTVTTSVMTIDRNA